jgi:hypothetical protein
LEKDICKSYLTTSIIFISVLIINFSAQAQIPIATNSIYFEALGNGITYSINYDRMFTENLGARIGFSYLSELDFIVISFKNLVTIPVTMNYFLGSGDNKFELGAGFTYVSIDKADVFIFEGHGGSGVAGTATIGYRYQQPGGGFLFRIGFTPLFNGKGILATGGISIGTSF